MAASKSPAQTPDQKRVLQLHQDNPDANPSEIAEMIDDENIKSEYVVSILNRFKLPEPGDQDTEETADESTDESTEEEPTTNTATSVSRTTTGMSAAPEDADMDESATEEDDSLSEEGPELRGVRRNDAQFALEKLDDRTKKQRGYIVLYVLEGRGEDAPPKYRLSKIAGASRTGYALVENDYWELVETLSEGIDEEFITRDELREAGRPYAEGNQIDAFLDGEPIELETDAESDDGADEETATDVAEEPTENATSGERGDADVYLGLTHDEAFGLLADSDVSEDIKRRLYDKVSDA